MATKAAVAVGTLGPTVTNTCDLTVSGFGTVSAAIIFSSGANTTNNPAAGGYFNVGFWVSGATNSAAVGGEDAVATANNARDRSDAHVLSIPDPGGASTLISATATAITDGIRLEVDASSASVTRYVTAILIGGATNAAIGQRNLGNTTSAFTVSVGFRPTLVAFAMDGNGGAGAPGVHSILSVGFAHCDSADAVSQTVAAYYAHDAASTMQTGSFVSASRCGGQVFSDAVAYHLTASAFDASGFSLTTSANAGSDVVNWLAIELPDHDDAYVGVIDSATSTGNQATTGTGFAPQALALLMGQCTAVDTVTQKGLIAAGVGDGTTQATIGVRNADGTADADTESWYNASNIAEQPLDDGTADTVASLSSLDSDGWTLNYSDASASARKWIALAIGDSTAGGASLNLTQTAAVALTGSITTSGDIQIGVGLDLSQTAAVALSGSVSVSGDIESLAGTLDLAQTAAVALSGSVSVSGDIQIGTSFDLAQSAAVALSGSATVSGDVQIGTSFDLSQTAAVALTGSVASTGDIQSSGSLDLTQTAAVALAGSVTVSGDIQIGTSFDLAQSGAVGLAGSVSVSGDIASSTDPIVVPSTTPIGGGNGRRRRAHEDDSDQVRAQNAQAVQALMAIVMTLDEIEEVA